MRTMLDIVGVAAALFAAHRSGLLRALIEGGGTPEELAAHLRLHPRAAADVLEVLRAAGFADQRAGTFTAGSMLREAEARLPMGALGLMALWSHAPRFLETGERFRRMDGNAAQRSAEYSTVVGGLAELFRPSALELAGWIGGNVGRVLDVGAGSGIWGLALAQTDTNARVTALDFPDVLEAFKREAEASGMTSRTALLAGDAYTTELPAGGFDTIVMANILHLEPAERAAVLLHRAADALSEQGRLVIVDVFGGDGLADLGRAVYALHLAMRTERGAAHRLQDVREWGEGAGLRCDDLLPFSDPMVPGLAALVTVRRSEERVEPERARAEASA